MRYLSILILSLMPIWASGDIEAFNDEIREDQSVITYYLKKAPDAKYLAVILQGSDCNSIYNNQFVLDNFADLTPETDTLLVEKYGITQSLPYTNGERQDCPKAYLDHDSMAQRVQDYVQILDQLKNSYEKIYLIGGSEGAVVAALISAIRLCGCNDCYEWWWAIFLG